MSDYKAKRGGRTDRSHVEGYADIRPSDSNNPRYLEEIGAIPERSGRTLEEQEREEDLKERNALIERHLKSMGKGVEPSINRAPASTDENGAVDLRGRFPEEEHYQQLMKLLGR